MNLHDLVSQLIVDTKGTAAWSVAPDSSLAAFLPETVICITIVLMLALKIFRLTSLVDSFYVALAGSVFAFAVGMPWTHLSSVVLNPESPVAVTRMEIFTGMLVYDGFTVYLRAVLLLFVVLFCLFTKISGIPHKSDGPDVYTLVLGATLGMCLMSSANHLFMVFLAVEMASVPSYALAGMLKRQRLSSEAALKYSVYGAGASGVMLYGLSLVGGMLNSAHLPTMAAQLAEKIGTMPSEQALVLALGGLLIMVGLCFKLSAVPFHFWCPDVFEGAAAEVNAFLSVASKAAALALLVRVAIGFGSLPPVGEQPGARTAKLAVSASQPATVQAPTSSGLMSVEDEPAKAKTDELHPPSQTVAAATPAAPLDRATVIKNLRPARDFIAKLIAFVAIITCTFGNLAAYGQTNIKRLMAYSTIAHAGYMMMAVPALIAMSADNPELAEKAAAALCVYIGIYLFMNLSVFAIIAFLRNAMKSEEIADYAGLLYRWRSAALWLSVVMFSLVGLPPLAGFIGKFAIFASLVDGYRVTREAGHPAYYLMILLVVGGINTAISLFYYLRIVKTMTMEAPRPDSPPMRFSNVWLSEAYMWLVCLPTVVLFFCWDRLNEAALAAARHLLS